MTFKNDPWNDLSDLNFGQKHFWENAYCEVDDWHLKEKYFQESRIFQLRRENRIWEYRHFLVEGCIQNSHHCVLVLCELSQKWMSQNYCLHSAHVCVTGAYMYVPHVTMHGINSITKDVQILFSRILSQPFINWLVWESHFLCKFFMKSCDNE